MGATLANGVAGRVGAVAMGRRVVVVEEVRTEVHRGVQRIMEQERHRIVNVPVIVNSSAIDSVSRACEKGPRERPQSEEVLKAVAVDTNGIVPRRASSVIGERNNSIDF